MNRLFEDWEEYDNRKIRDRRDGNYFSCEEAWEVDYLVSKIRRHFPNIPEGTIRTAIAMCCSQVGAPRPRKQFVECVAKRLGIQ